MTETDLQYYERRCMEEHTLATGATNTEAASAHRALSLIYADEIRRRRKVPMAIRASIIL